MKHLLTLSDINYLTCGLALYDSLSETASCDFILHYLAMDSKTKQKLEELNKDNIVIYTLDDLDGEDFEKLKTNNTSSEEESSKGHSAFHFMLSSFFTHYIMNNVDCEDVLYIDSDILFYRDVNLIFDTMEKSVGLITHKHMPLDKTSRNPGYYNVGVVYFKNDSVGNDCLNFWRECCIYPDNEYSEIFGACWDQKYLELFGEKFGEDNIQNLCLTVGNGAPWNFTLFTFLDDNKIIWNDYAGNVLDVGSSIEQDLVFNHFSHFTPDYQGLSYTYDRQGEWGREIRIHPGVPELYWNYFDKLLSTREKYEL
tara:strand:+ start:2593 stop:3525 length:933 start_codon:yes stop_codon:yes gene_type:complete